MKQFRGKFESCVKNSNYHYRSTEYIQDTKQDNKLHQHPYL